MAGGKRLDRSIGHNHLEENIAVLDIRLTPEQRARVEAAVSNAVAGLRSMGGVRRT